MAKRPTKEQKWLASTLVGLAVGAVTAKYKGVGGFLVATFLAGVAHQAFDAPAARFIADVT